MNFLPPSKNNELDIGFLVGGNQANWQEHLAHFKKMLDAAAGNQVQRPLYINCHSGRDFLRLNRTKHLLTIPHWYQNKPALPFAMKRIVRACCLQRRWQDGL